MAIRVPTIRLVPGRSPQGGAFDYVAAGRRSDPLISCLMVTRGGTLPGSFAVDCYPRQTWRNREVVIVCDRPNSAIKAVVDTVDDPSIRCVAAQSAWLGVLRNISVAYARRDLLCQWDDDDLYHAEWLDFMATALLDHAASAVLLQPWRIWWPARRQLVVREAVAGRGV
jgi:hypothetical protein